MLDKIQVVLSHTTHPGNIGATARAMKVMGLSRLALVNPQKYPSAEATERASRATDILADAVVTEDLNTAIAESKLIVGTSARTRSLPSKLITPRKLTEIIQESPTKTPVSILFGTENSGLTNEELHLCHYHVYIPTNPDYSSLNLASAVQLICYELRLAFAEGDLLPEQPVVESEEPINRAQFDGMLEHFLTVMRETGYLMPDHEKQIDIRLNRLLNKAEVTQSEMNILRGFLRSVEYQCAKTSNIAAEKDSPSN
ncbi:RNA methyltransferase [Aliikangiella marina]|uniref:tRNA (cytidine/uridine-2'-O-)-methyltransferase TrmJ n=1 Tax=Aliikangiella marina TaxID=1712262 RepID=A0A545THS3_9GAMM|nr:RNA methyltransferase [Aliikangiella marina]TQV76773.1 RNA methyltransferase [Aliikangiella marina]